MSGTRVVSVSSAAQLEASRPKSTASQGRARITTYSLQTIINPDLNNSNNPNDFLPGEFDSKNEYPPIGGPACTTGIILYSAAICLDFLAIIFYHYCFFGSCWLNAETDKIS